MQHKILKLFIPFIMLFSLQGYSQTTKESKHPLLDKYYPRAEKDTNKATKASPVPEIYQVPQAQPVAKTAPAPVVTEKTNTPPPGPETKLTAKPISAPAVANANIIGNQASITATLPETKLSAETIPSVTLKDSANANKVISSSVALPVHKTVQARPPSTPYMDTRLGSSTPAYDTWQKNNNGAGSVTTSPK
ncbi:MAG: hypothetical protein M3Z92_14005 [Bacteroidota bacterium]|nr:hypothetical protein [Bacteroidota bacterium]